MRVLQLNLLVSGYIRSESKCVMPTVLIKLCTAYFGMAFHWNFYGKDLRNFLTSKSGEVLFSQPFQINNLVFQCSIRPNQYDETRIGYVGFKLILKQVTMANKSSSSSSSSSSHRQNYGGSGSGGSGSGDFVIDYELNCDRTESSLNLVHRDQYRCKPRAYNTSGYSPKALSEAQHSSFSMQQFVSQPTIVAAYSFYDVMIASDRGKDGAFQSLCFGCHIIGIEKCTRKKKRKIAQTRDEAAVFPHKKRRRV